MKLYRCDGCGEEHDRDNLRMKLSRQLDSLSGPLRGDPRVYQKTFHFCNARCLLDWIQTPNEFLFIPNEEHMK